MKLTELSDNELSETSKPIETQGCYKRRIELSGGISERVDDFAIQPRGCRCHGL